MNDMSDLSNAVVSQSLAGRRLENKSVILTGAAGSIGRYISRHLLREGAMVTMTGRDQSKLDAFVEELSEEGFDADNISTIVGDCADPQVCRDIVDQAVGAFGKLDVLVNNAGAAGPKYTLRDIPFTDVEMRAAGSDQTMFDSAMNLLGAPWNMARAAAAHLTDGGTIVNVSTIFSRTHYYGRIPYVVPKSGLNALGKGLALELGDERGIRVNTLLPGFIDTPFNSPFWAAQDDPAAAEQALATAIPMRRQGTPDDVSGVVTFLASPAARYILDVEVD